MTNHKARRGRPPLLRPEMDAGTPELQEKRRAFATAEPLDLCLHYRLLTEAEHAACQHWRWLYTLHYGSGNYATVNLHGHESRQRDQQWLQVKHDDFQRLHGAIRGLAVYPLFENLVIFRLWPDFLRQVHLRALTGKAATLPDYTKREVKEFHMIVKTLCGAVP